MLKAAPRIGRFFEEFKERLKFRFRQIDLWIISYEIEII